MSSIYTMSTKPVYRPYLVCQKCHHRNYAYPYLDEFEKYDEIKIRCDNCLNMYHTVCKNERRYYK